MRGTKLSQFNGLLNSTHSFVLKNHRLLQLLALIGGVLLAVIILVLTRPEPGTELAEVQPLKVLVVPAQRATLTPEERVTGRLQPVKRVALSFEVAGRLAERHVEPGMTVQAGAVLLSLDSGDLGDLYAEAEAQYQLELAGVERDRELLALARRNRKLQDDEVKRLESLGERSLASRSQLDAARQRLLQLQAEEAQLDYAVTTAEARLTLKRSMRDRAQRNFERSRLVAPFAGTVNAVHIDLGDAVSVNAPAVELVDTSALDLYVEIRGEVANNLVLGQPVKVRVDGREVAGTVQALQKDPSRDTNTHAIRIRIAGDAARPGVLATATLGLVPLDNVLTVPATAVLSIDGRSYVFALRGKTIERLAVELGMRVDGLYAVRAGLADGALIVARDVAVLADGQTVVPESLSAGTRP